MIDIYLYALEILIFMKYRFSHKSSNALKKVTFINLHLLWHATARWKSVVFYKIVNFMRKIYSKSVQPYREEERGSILSHIGSLEVTFGKLKNWILLILIIIRMRGIISWKIVQIITLQEFLTDFQKRYFCVIIISNKFWQWEINNMN